MSHENNSHLCEICGAVEWENVINGVATKDVQDTLTTRHIYKLDGIRGEGAAFVRGLVPCIATLARRPPSCPMCRLWLRAYMRAYPEADPAKDDQKSPWFSYYIPKTNYGIEWRGHPRGIDDDAQALAARKKAMNSFRMRFRSYESQRDFERPLELTCIDEDLAPGARSRGGRLLPDEGCRLGLFKDWLQLCQAEHGDACEDQLPMSVMQNAGDHVKLRLIDVEKLNVVVKSFDTPYVALSYVWGSANCFRVERDMFKPDPQNASELFLDLRPYLPSADASSATGTADGVVSPVVIPPTIVDAMEVTRALGQRYLWVDSVCIINHTKELTNTIEAMDVIYKRALLTIVGAAGSNCTAGLPRAHPRAPRITQIKEHVQGRTFIMAQPSLDFVLKSCVWSTRGWTFQESKLSRRKLIFTSSGIYFRCRKDTWAEDSIEKLVLGAAFQGRRQRPPSVPYTARNTPESKKETVFADYTFDVRLYTARTLREQSDVLKAFTGLLSELQKTTLPTEFLWGLPQCHLDAALLWKATQNWSYKKWAYRPAPPGQAQWSQERAAEGFSWRNQNTPTDFPRLTRIPDFPSWSWCGWQGAMGYFPRTVTEANLELLTSIQSFITWPWLSSNPHDTHWKQDLADGTLTFHAWTVSVDFARLPYGFAADTYRAGWAGWPMDAEAPLLNGAHECILLSRQLRNPVEKVYYRDTEPESEVKLVNVMVVARDHAGLLSRRGIGMMREDIWWAFDPQFRKIKLR